MVRGYMRASFLLQEIEESSGRVLDGLAGVLRLANPNLGLNPEEAVLGGRIELYLHTCRAIEGLKKEVSRQTQLIRAARDELKSGEDEHKGGDGLWELALHRGP